MCTNKNVSKSKVQDNYHLNSNQNVKLEEFKFVTNLLKFKIKLQIYC